MRSFDGEESSREVTSHVSDWRFASTRCYEARSAYRKLGPTCVFQSEPGAQAEQEGDPAVDGQGFRAKVSQGPVQCL